jgi:tetratricopeptide (TPR) repeat protein
MKRQVLYFIVSILSCHTSLAQDSISYKIGLKNYSDLKFNDAIYWFTKSIEAEQYRLSESYRYRGMAKAFNRDFESAKKDLFYSYILDSSNVRVYYQIGKFYYLQDMFDSSINWYSKAINKNSTDPDFYDSRALAYTGLKQLSKALDDINIALKFKPDNDIYLNNRGLIKQKQLKYQEALEDFNRVLKIDSSLVNNLSTYINISFCHLKTGQYNKALEECNKVIDQIPNVPYALLVRGQVYMALLKTEAACDDFNLLYDLDSKMGKEYVEKFCNKKK